MHLVFGCPCHRRKAFLKNRKAKKTKRLDLHHSTPNMAADRKVLASKDPSTFQEKAETLLTAMAEWGECVRAVALQQRQLKDTTAAIIMMDPVGLNSLATASTYLARFIDWSKQEPTTLKS
jgi:hypothetical protein